MSVTTAEITKVTSLLMYRGIPTLNAYYELDVRKAYSLSFEKKNYLHTD